MTQMEIMPFDTLPILNKNTTATIKLTLETIMCVNCEAFNGQTVDRSLNLPTVFGRICLLYNERGRYKEPKLCQEQECQKQPLD